jgi:hypothetical protein
MEYGKIFEGLFREANVRGTYAGVRYSPETERLIKTFITRYDIPNPNLDIHTTLLYSTSECPNYMPDTVPAYGDIKFKEFRYFGSSLVIELDAPGLVMRHKALMKLHNAVYDHDEYIPHITLSYDCNVELSKLQQSYFNFKFIPTTEYKEDLVMEKMK